MKKDISLTEAEVLEMISGNLKELINSSRYFYSSTVDSSYSRLTKDGEEYLAKIMNVYLPLLKDAVDSSIDARAKEIVLNTLKMENPQ